MLFFFYGTLLSKCGNNVILQAPGVEFLGNHTTDPGYTMLKVGGFPAVLPFGNTAIKGELYKVTNERVIQRLYALEGYSGNRGSSENWYDTYDIESPHGLASMFIWHDNNRNLPIIKSGDFLNQ